MPFGPCAAVVSTCAVPILGQCGQLMRRESRTVECGRLLHNKEGISMQSSAQVPKGYHPPPPRAHGVRSWGSHVHCDTGPPMRASSATSVRERISCGRGRHSLDHDLASSPRLESQGTTRRPERALELALGPRSARLAILKFALPVALILLLWSDWLSENALNKIKCS